jgi:hypothetical protein
MFSATKRTTVLGSPIDPKTAPRETMLNAKKYAPNSCGESRRARRPLVTMPSMAPPILPPEAQALPESKRRLRNEPLKYSPTVDFSMPPRHSAIGLLPKLYD